MKNQSGIFKNKNIYKPSFFNVMNVEITDQFPNSYIYLDFDEQTLCNRLGFDELYFDETTKKRKPKFQIQKVVYANGDVEDSTTALLTNAQIMKIPYESYEQKRDFINSGLYFYQSNCKPIIELEVKVITNFAITKEYILEKNQKSIKIDNFDITIIKLNDNEITYSLPTELAEKIEVNAIYKNGEYLKSTGSQTFESNYKIAQLQSYINTLKKAKIEVLNQKLKTKNELKNFVESNIEKSTMKPDKTTTHSKYFSTKIDKIVFSIFQKDKPVKAVHSYSIRKFQIDRIMETGYELCVDTKTKKMGVIDLNGNWIIQPIYHHLTQESFLRNYITEVTEDDNTNIDYWIDKKNKKLIKPDYSFSSELEGDDSNDLIIVKSNDKSKDHWLIGIANKDTGKIIIPIEYQFINYSKGNILCEMPNKKGIKIFNRSGVQIGFKMSDPKLHS